MSDEKKVNVDTDHPMAERHPTQWVPKSDYDSLLKKLKVAEARLEKCLYQRGVQTQSYIMQNFPAWLWDEKMISELAQMDAELNQITEDTVK